VLGNKRIHHLDEEVRLRGCEELVRQVAVTGLGRDSPTLFLSNSATETPQELLFRYARRNRVDDGLGSSVNFFHLRCCAGRLST
jgi:hypothetical protein